MDQLKRAIVQAGVVLGVLASGSSGRAQTPPLAAEVPAQPPAAEAQAAPAEASPRVEPAPAAAPELRSAPAAESVDLSAYLEAEKADQIAAASEPSLRLYGFADFSARYISDSALSAIYGASHYFQVGNINVYAEAKLDERWRSLLELRFTYLPNGTLDSTLHRTSTVVQDPVNLGATFRWGGISVERVWLEYAAHELLTIRVGQWLTPVGIWNVDHGTPTIIPAFRPYVVSAALFPTSQTGIQLLGSRLFGETTLGYHLTLSNGRGTADTYMDLDRNKAIGGRVYVTVTALGTLTLGASAFLGRSTDADVSLASSGALALAIVTQYDEASLAADLLWQWQGVHLQLELFRQDVAFTEAGRQAPFLPAASGGLAPDHRRQGGYVLLGYRLPWLTLMPFIELDMIDNGGMEVIVAGGPHTVYTMAVGINLRPIPSVTLKLQAYNVIFESADGESAAFQSIMAMAAWSF